MVSSRFIFANNEVIAVPSRSAPRKIEVVKLATFRTFFILCLFLTFMLTLIVVAGWVGIKVEAVDEEEIDIGLFAICTVSELPRGYDCNSGYLDDYYAENMEPWFNALRYLFTIAFILTFIAFMYSLIMIAFTKNKTNRNLWICGVLQFVTAACLVTVQVLFHANFAMDFLGAFREDGLGWTELTDIDEAPGDGYYAAWACFCLCILNIPQSVLLTGYEIKFFNDYNVKYR